MPSSFSIHNLAATLLPNVYSARYEQNLAAHLDSQLLPYENHAQSRRQLHVPLRFRERHAEGRAVAAAQDRPIDIWDLLFRSPRLAIVAEPGAGKTNALKCVAITLARREMPTSYARRLTFLHQGQAFDHLLPVYADLSQVDPDADELVSFLAEVVAQYGFPGAAGFLGARLTEGSCLLLLDNLDALDAASRGRLRELLAAYPRAQTVVAARTTLVAQAFPDWPCFQPLPFSESEAQTYVHRRLGEDTPASRALLYALERNAALRSLSENPLLLAVLSWASERAPSQPLPLPELYEACIRVLWGDEAGTEPDAGSTTDNREFRARALQQLGHYFHAHRQERFTEKDLAAACEAVMQRLGQEERAPLFLSQLRKSGLVRELDGEGYTFLRRGLQEYLTGRAIVAAKAFPETLEEHAVDRRWHEVIVIATAVLGSATDVVSRLLASGLDSDEALLLSARCATEATTVAHDLKDQLRRELFRFLQSDDAACWQPAAVCLAALEGLRVRDLFPSMLREGPVEERELAALVMGRIGSSDWATGPLLGALDEKNPWQVRQRAAWALGQLGNKRAVPALVEALKDAREQVASEAALALGIIGEPAVPALISALSSDPPMVRRMAVQGLAKMGALAVGPLLHILQDENQPDDTVSGAADALGLLRDASAIPPLTGLLRARAGRLADHAAQALAAIGEAAVQPLIDCLPTQKAELKLRKAIVTALVDIGEPSIEALIHALDSPNTAVRAAAEEALAGIGAPATDALTVALRTDDWSLRRRIAQILARTGDARLAEPLLSALRDQDPGVRARAAQILGQVGQDTAVQPLVEVMQDDEDEFVRRSAVRALAELRSEPTMAPLITALGDPALRETAVPALSEMGESVVELLIVAANQSREPDVQQACVQVLGAIGARGRPEDPNMLAVAHVYSRLFREQPPLDEMLTLLEHIRWWEPGEELYQAFACVQQLLEAQSVSEVAECPEQLFSASGLQAPFRPAIRNVLRDLNNVAQDLRLYLHNGRREGQRDAMLSAINTMIGIQEAIDTQLLGFERGPFQDLLSGWHALTDAALESLRGRAELEVELLTEDLPLGNSESTATIVFSLANMGDSAARNLRVALKPSGKREFEILGEPAQRLEPLATGRQRNIEFLVKPLDVTAATVAFEVSYDDDEGADHHYTFSGRVRFFKLDEEYRPLPTSPYVMALPVKTPELFYGRQDIFAWIDENISGAYQESILILHGERRMGKTSILYQLLNRPPSPHHICAFFSLELATTTSLGDLFYDMAFDVQRALAQAGMSITEPDQEDLIKNAQRSFRAFCEQTEHALGDRRLLIMVDEIDILIDKVEQGLLSQDVFSFLRGLMQHSDKIAFVFTGARKVREMMKDSQSILFNMARTRRVSYLKPNEAKALIVEPVSGDLTYDELVIDKILRVSACHPYFIQYICDSLYKLAQRAQKNYVSLPDLEVVLQDVVQDNTGQLRQAVYEILSKAEQKALAALSSVTDDYRILVPAELVLQVLEQHRLSLTAPELLGALHSLSERDLVVEKRIGQSLQYGFKMGLIRMWLRQNEMLLRLSEEARI